MYVYQEGIRPDIITRRIKRKLDEADKQFERINLRGRDGYDLYAACFVMLKFTTQHTNNEIEENMKGVFDLIMNDRGEACFLTTYLVDDPIVYGGYNYPGIAVFGWRADA